MRLIISAILIILWLLFGIIYIKPCVDSDCANKTSATTTQTSKNDASANAKKDATSNALTTTSGKVTGPLLFNWNKENAVTGDGWDDRRKAILDKLQDGEVLEITGQYRADEANGTTSENLGVARALEVAKLLKPPLTDDRITVRGQLVKESDSDKTSPFKSIAFRYLKNTNTIKEIDNQTTIYFPPNSDKRIQNAEIEAYLNDVAERVKKTGETIKITGHTDNLDSRAHNQVLGLKRANIVKDYLVSKGVSPSKINTSSKGETEPEVSNRTREGRAKNRRAVLEIIK